METETEIEKEKETETERERREGEGERGREVNREKNEKRLKKIIQYGKEMETKWRGEDRKMLTD